MMKTFRSAFFLFQLSIAQSVWAEDVSFAPDPGNIAHNDIFTLDINASGFLGVVDGGGVNVVFDPAILQVLSVTIDSQVWNFINSDGVVDNVAGTVSDILVTAFPAVADSDFIVATVEFQAVGSGISNLQLTESSINPFARDGALIDPTFTGGVIEVQGLIQPDGDINSDGVVDAADVLLATRAALGVIVLSPDQFMHADVAPLVSDVPSPDGEFNAADVMQIKRKMLGSISF